MLRTRSRTIIAVLGLAAIVLAGCSGSAATKAPAVPATTASTQVPATATPTDAAPSAAAVADICAAADASGGEPIAAGPYRFPAPATPFTLTLSAGYGVSCSGSTLALFGPEGSIALVVGVSQIGPGGAAVAVEPTIDAVEAAITAAAASAEGPKLATIGDIEGTSRLVTTPDAGIIVKGADGRGWGWSKEEAATALVTMVEIAPGTIVVAIRSVSAGAVAVGEDVMNSIAFE